MQNGLDRRMVMVSLGATALLGGCVSDLSSTQYPLLVDPGREPDEVWPLWPDGVPGKDRVTFQEEVIERDNPLGLRDRAAINVTDPNLSVFRAARPVGKSLLIIPGGGYARVVIDKEGFEGARYFARQGIDCYVLKYRLPHRDWPSQKSAPAPLVDAIQAIRLIRSSSASGKHVSVMGFSAGGHLAGLLCERYQDPVSRPDQGVLVYPVALMSGPYAHQGSRANLLGEAPKAEESAALDLTYAPRQDGPSMALVHAMDDTSVPVENSLQLAQSLQAVARLRGIRIFNLGGHGFGFRVQRAQSAVIWPVGLM